MLQSCTICHMSGRVADVVGEAAGVLLLHGRGITMDALTIKRYSVLSLSVLLGWTLRSSFRWLKTRRREYAANI